MVDCAGDGGVVNCTFMERKRLIDIGFYIYS